MKDNTIISLTQDNVIIKQLGGSFLRKDCIDHFLSQILYLEINGSEVVTLHMGPGHQNRNQVMLEMIRCAFQQNPSSKRLRCYIFTGDNRPAESINGYPLLSIAGPRLCQEYIVPDPYNWRWDAIGCGCFFKSAKELSSISSQAPIIHRAMWRGRTDQHRSRRACVDRMKLHPDCFDVADVLENPDDKAFISHLDHSKYSVLLDFPGIGYSARVKMLAYSGRALVLFPRIDWDWATIKMEPNVHFSYPQETAELFMSEVAYLLNDPPRQKFYTRHMATFLDYYMTKNNMLLELSKIITRTGE